MIEIQKTNKCEIICGELRVGEYCTLQLVHFLFLKIELYYVLDWIMYKIV